MDLTKMLCFIFAKLQERLTKSLSDLTKRSKTCWPQIKTVAADCLFLLYLIKRDQDNNSYPSTIFLHFLQYAKNAIFKILLKLPFWGLSFNKKTAFSMKTNDCKK